MTLIAASAIKHYRDDLLPKDWSWVLSLAKFSADHTEPSQHESLRRLALAAYLEGRFAPFPYWVRNCIDYSRSNPTYATGLLRRLADMGATQQKPIDGGRPQAASKAPTFQEIGASIAISKGHAHDAFHGKKEFPAFRWSALLHRYQHTLRLETRPTVFERVLLGLASSMCAVHWHVTGKPESGTEVGDAVVFQTALLTIAFAHSFGLGDDRKAITDAMINERAETILNLSSPGSTPMVQRALNGHVTRRSASEFYHMQRSQSRSAVAAISQLVACAWNEEDLDKDKLRAE
jgi:hypothetical protein